MVLWALERQHGLVQRRGALRECSACRHGELSQAMRNRGIEIFMGSASAASADVHSPEAADLEALLAVAGVPGNALPEAMVAAHMACLLQATLHHR